MAALAVEVSEGWLTGRLYLETRELEQRRQEQREAGAKTLMER
jgi:hypothetical protein